MHPVDCLEFTMKIIYNATFILSINLPLTHFILFLYFTELRIIKKIMMFFLTGDTFSLSSVIRLISSFPWSTGVWMQTWLSLLINFILVLQSTGVLRPKSMTCGNRWWTTAWALGQDPCEPIKRDRFTWGWSFFRFYTNFYTQAKFR